MDKSDNKRPRVSVVTIVWNNREHIADAIESVLAQDYPDIEYIVKDGGSTDGTLDIIQKYKGRLKLLTGKDKGLYDALNKGLQAATGDILMHLNSDDFYTRNNSISKIVEAMERTKADIAWGNMIYVDRADRTKITRRWRSSAYAPGKFQTGWHPPHAGFSVRREVYAKYGWFNTDFKISADYELMLRFLERQKVPSCYVPETIVTMRSGGVSGRTWNRLTRVRREDLAAWRLNGLSGGLLATLLKPLSKLSQF
jgi:glycosyltransferase involved in cell wall biosynthesis